MPSIPKLAAAITAVLLVIGLDAAPAGADDSSPSPLPTDGLAIGPATPGVQGCPIATNSVSGVAATPAGIAVISGATVADLGYYEITTFDASCATTAEDWDLAPYAPQDMLFHDGSFYICDCGNPDQSRTVYAMVVVTPGQVGGQIYRYWTDTPGPAGLGPMVLDGQGRPVFFAILPPGRASAVYTTPELGTAGARPGVELTLAGQWKSPTTPGNLLSGTSGVASAAVSPDGSRVVLRTSTDAYEYQVTDGDVVDAVLHGTPVVTPLPSDPCSGQITYSADGSRFITVPAVCSEQVTSTQLMTYTPYSPPAAGSASPTSTFTSTAAAETGGSLVSRLRQPPYRYAVAGLVALVVLIALISIIAGARRRRRRRDDDWGGDGFDDQDDRGGGQGGWGTPTGGGYGPQSGGYDPGGGWR